MIFTEVLNAISMFFPFAAMRKHKKTKSKLKHLMVIHIPISFVYHACRALRIDNKIVKTLFTLDILCIQASSAITSIEYKYKTKKPLLSHCLVSIPLHYMAYEYREFPLYRTCIIAYDNKCLMETSYKKNIILTGIYCCLFFNVSYHSKFEVGHSMFHVCLYRVYDIYFKLIDM